MFTQRAERLCIQYLVSGSDTEMADFSASESDFNKAFKL